MINQLHEPLLKQDKQSMASSENTFPQKTARREKCCHKLGMHFILELATLQRADDRMCV